jgi:ubiquinone/menaquinone biosynthesis C-methylase UbiE
MGVIVRRLLRTALSTPKRITAREAYRLWASTYDAQPNNLLLALEEEVFAELLACVDLEGRAVLDVGCGTGRHWQRLWAARPGALAGVDTSPEMLVRLRERVPGADVRLVSDTRLEGVADASVDVVVSTLTIGHIAALGSALGEWTRVLRPGGIMILTDFHPEAFRVGMKRTFVHSGTTFEVEHHLHSLDALVEICRGLTLEIRETRERVIDEGARAYCADRKQAAVFRRAQGTPIVLGMILLKRRP